MLPLILIITFLVLVFSGLLLLYRQNLSIRQDLQRLENLYTQQFHQFEAYNYVKDRLQLNHGLPYTPYWSAGPDFLKLICDYTLQNKPHTILECSSGLTSLVLARCCEINKKGKLYSLEHEAEYTQASQQHISRYALDNYASIIHAPLQTYDINGISYSWYSLGQVPDDSIDMLVIDGPPGFLQKHSRYPALPLLHKKMAKHCTIFMDDATRQDELEIVEMWKKEFPAIEVNMIKTERGCAIISLIQN